MTASPTPPDGNTVDPGRPNIQDIGLNPRLHGNSRVPGERRPRFDLNAFTRAIEQGDIAYLLARYAPGAAIHIIDPDNPPASPRTLRGTPAIHAWLLNSSAKDLDLHVTNFVRGGDCVAFTARWHYEDGTEVLATSTAAVHDGLIGSQHTVVVHDKHQNPPGGPSTTTALLESIERSYRSMPHPPREQDRIDWIADFGNRGRVKRDNDVILCRDGFELSVAAGGGTHSSPRTLVENSDERPGPDTVSYDYPGPYSAVEVLPYGAVPPHWTEYRHDDLFANVPINMVRDLIRQHGGQA
jgi:hypothetical protein